MKCCEKICEKPIVLEDEMDEAFFDAIGSLVSHTDNKVDINIFKYVVKQKDIIISELNKKIVFLNEQLKLARNDSSMGDPILNIAGDMNVLKKPVNNTSSDTEQRSEKSEVIHQPQMTDSNEELLVINSPRTDDNCDMRRTNDIQGDSKFSWKTVTHTKPKKSKKAIRPLIVGNYTGESNVSGIERHVSFHVTNLHHKTGLMYLTTSQCEG